MGLDVSLGQILPVHDRPDDAARAVKACLWRIDHAGADPGDIRWALEALGLIDLKTSEEGAEDASGPVSGVP